MIMLYLALLTPFILKRIKNKKIVDIMIIIYLIYSTIVFAGFLSYIFDPTINCEWIKEANSVHLDLN